MTTIKNLKTPLTIYFNEDDFNKILNRADITVESVNKQLKSAKENGFIFNDEEAMKFIQGNYNEALIECLKRTEKLKYEVNPDAFKKQLILMSNQRIHFIPTIPGCFLIKDQKAVISENWKESERSFRTASVNTTNGLEKFQSVQSLADEVNKMLDKLNDEFIFTDIFRIDESGKTVPFPLQYDEL